MTNSNKILLTGAGFTHDFGTPLSSDMWCAIFNCPGIQQTKEIRQELLRNINFESVYHKILNGNYSETAKQEIIVAVEAAYRDKVEAILNKYDSKIDQDFDFDKFSEFVRAFSFVFTLNQDLFMERFFLSDLESGKPKILGMNHFLRIKPDERTQLEIVASGVNKYPRKISKYLLLRPQNIKADEKSQMLHGSNSHYVKLHGSQNWFDPDFRIESECGQMYKMILGENKIDKINNEPLLKFYFQIFTETLNNIKNLWIIGYSFHDKHINDEISKAITNGLKIHIINPMSAKDFHAELKSKPNGIAICDGLAAYYPYTLRQFFKKGTRILD